MSDLLAGGALSPLTCFLVRKGVLWLLFATMADVPPVVSAECFLLLIPFRSIPSNVSGVNYYEFER